jgi:hypothetical protein
MDDEEPTAGVPEVPAGITFRGGVTLPPVGAGNTRKDGDGPESAGV